MADLTFITGNANKAAYVADVLGQLLDHRKMDLDEIQSLDLSEIVAHKARQAFEHLSAPVLVEDVSLEFHALGRLPGPFIKWFIEEVGNEKICAMLSNEYDRSATARICYGIFDGRELRLFEGSMQGAITTVPRGENGFGWDQLFIKDGMDKTRAELDDTTEKATSMRHEPLRQIAAYLRGLA